jgi:hypothetical protein
VLVRRLVARARWRSRSRGIAVEEENAKTQGRKGAKKRLRVEVRVGDRRVSGGRAMGVTPRRARSGRRVRTLRRSGRSGHGELCATSAVRSNDLANRSFEVRSNWIMNPSHSATRYGLASRTSLACLAIGLAVALVGCDKGDPIVVRARWHSPTLIESVEMLELRDGQRGYLALGVHSGNGPNDTVEYKRVVESRDLVPFLRPIESPDQARRVLELLRMFGARDVFRGDEFVL